MKVPLKKGARAYRFGGDSATAGASQIRSASEPAKLLRIDITYDVVIASAVCVVLDTNVIVAGLRSPAGASGELLRRLRDGEGELLLSLPLLLEYQAVCTLGEHLTASQLTRIEVLQVLDVLAAIATPVEIRYLWRPRLRDAADEMVLETAMNGRAGALVTFNERDFRPAAQLFALWVATPKAILERMAT